MNIKSTLLSKGPFKQIHVGLWLRTMYFRWYIRRYVDASRTKKILDAGCGRGEYSRLLARLLPNAHISAVDILRVKEWESPPPNVTFLVQDLQNLAQENEYDLVVSVDVLEHIPNNIDVIARIARALRPGGYFYLAVPCEEQEQYLFSKERFARFQEWERDEHVGEQHTYSDLSGILKNAGLEVVFSRYTFTFFGKLAWELETLLHWGNPTMQRLRVILMPLLKMLGLFDILFPIGTGNNLFIAKKRAI